MNREQIGVIGICGSVGFVLGAAHVDLYHDKELAPFDTLQSFLQNKLTA